MKKNGLFLLLAGVFLLMTFFGCTGGNTLGGNPPPGGSASAAVTIQWPAVTKLIPTAAQSIKIVLSDGSGYTSSQTVDRPASGNSSTVTFINVPVGTLTVTATAYPQAGGLGTPQAAGTSQITTVSGQQATITLTMASTIDHIDITSSGLTVATGGTLALSAAPKDTAGNVVLVAAGNITWTSGTTAVATVNSSGVVSGVSAGTSLITAKESDSQKTASVTVTVTAASGPNLTVTIDATVDISAGTSKATSFTSADLLNSSGATVKTATVSGTTATFNMGGLTAGTYFMLVNGLADDLVPIRLNSTSAAATAFVGARLRNVLIGSKASPDYQIVTYSKGQGKSPIVKYSNGTAATPARYSYMLLGLKTPRVIENRVLGTGAQLSSLTPTEHSFPSWIVGASSHATKATTSCGCHNPVDSKPASYSSINESNGWCYKCHYSKTGTSTGLVDPAQ